MKNLLLSAALFAGSAVAGHASTIDLGFDDFVITGGQIQNGNCPFDENPCLLLNTSALVTIMLDGGGAFTLDSFAYTMQGTSTVSATSDLGGVFTDANGNGNSDDLTADLSGVSGFAGVTTVTFDNITTGSLRIGSFSGTAPMPMPAVPLPAAGLMLLTALGGAAALRRRAA